MSATSAGAQSFTRRHHARVWTLLVALFALTLAFPSSARAQSDATGSLSLVDQTSWVTGGSPFNLELRPSTSLPTDQAEIVVTVYGATLSRSQYRQSIDGRMSGSSIALDRRPLADVIRPDGTAGISLPVQDPNQKRFYLKNAGVYPVKVELRATESGDVLDGFITHIVNQPQVAPTRLGVATILPVQSPQSLDTKDPFAIDDKGRSVSIISQALADHPALPLTLQAEPETLDRLRRTENDPTAAVVADLANAQNTRPVLATTWVPLGAASFDKDLADETNRQFDAGKATLQSTFSTVDNTVWAATEQPDTNTLNTLEKRGISQLVLREQDLATDQRTTTLTRPFVVANGKNKTAFHAVQADAGLADHFADPGGPVLGAHHLLADLAVLWNDRPANERAVVVMPPRNWLPDSTFLDTYFSGLESSPVAAAQSVTSALATPVEGGTRTPLTLRLNAVPKSDTQDFPTSEINEQRRRLDALTSMTNGTNAVLDDLLAQQLLTQRADLDSTGHQEWVDALKSAIDKQLGGIHLPKERSIRLTSRQGEIPVTVQNDNGYPVQVRVRLSAGKLEFPAGDERLIDATRQYVTERFTVDARTSGAFAVQVQLESPDGSLILQKSEITVRSTATSVVGVVLSSGALTFLVIWWIRSAFRSRREQAQAA